jgi:transposase InsO family protein
VPEHIRSDNGAEFTAKAVQEWIAAVGAKTAYIAPGSPWENGFIESFNARLGTNCSMARSSIRSRRHR